MNSVVKYCYEYIMTGHDKIYRTNGETYLSWLPKQEWRTIQISHPENKEFDRYAFLIKYYNEETEWTS